MTSGYIAWEAWQDANDRWDSYRPRRPWSKASPPEPLRSRDRPDAASSDQPPPQRQRLAPASTAAPTAGASGAALPADPQQRKAELCERVRRLTGRSKDAWKDWARESRAEGGVGWKADPRLNTLETLEGFFARSRPSTEGAADRSRSRTGDGW